MLPINANEIEAIGMQTNPFDDALKRRSFVTRVYSLMFVALAITAIQIYVVLSR